MQAGFGVQLDSQVRGGVPGQDLTRIDRSSRSHKIADVHSAKRVEVELSTVDRIDGPLVLTQAKRLSGPEGGAYLRPSWLLAPGERHGWGLSVEVPTHVLRTALEPGDEPRELLDRFLIGLATLLG